MKTPNKYTNWMYILPPPPYFTSSPSFPLAIKKPYWGEGGGGNLQFTPPIKFYKVPHLEVDDNAEDEDGCHEVHEVGEVLPVEGLPQGADLVLSGGKQVAQSDHCPVEFGS